MVEKIVESIVNKKMFDTKQAFKEEMNDRLKFAIEQYEVKEDTSRLSEGDTTQSLKSKQKKNELEARKQRLLSQMSSKNKKDEE